MHGGYVCPLLNEVNDCNTMPCALDMEVSQWGAWGACSLSCGSGTRTRSRSVVNGAQHGGRTYGLTQNEDCNEHECMVDCVPTAWGSWSVCDKTCGGGRRTRSRGVQSAAQYGGKECVLVGHADCNSHTCGCTHIKCAYLKHETHHKFSIRVMHHKDEKNGFYHTCGLDHATGDCHCECTHHSLGDNLYMLIPHGATKGSHYMPDYQSLSEVQRQHLIEKGITFPGCDEACLKRIAGDGVLRTPEDIKYDPHYTGFHSEIAANIKHFAGLDYKGTAEAHIMDETRGSDNWHNVQKHHWHNKRVAASAAADVL